MLFFLLGFAPLCFPHAYDGEDDEWGRTDHEMLVYFYLQKGFLLVDSSRTGPQDRKPRWSPLKYQVTAHIKCQVTTHIMTGHGQLTCEKDRKPRQRQWKGSWTFFERQLIDRLRHRVVLSRLWPRQTLENMRLNTLAMVLDGVVI
jgi:hypothetical protein